MDDLDDSSRKIDGSNLMSMHVEELDLPKRARNGLRRADIAQVGELVRRTPPQLLAMPHMGATTVRDVNHALSAFGLRLGMTADDVMVQTAALAARKRPGPRFNGNAISGADAGDIMSMHVDELSLSIRASNCLRSAEITSLADLVRKTPSELLAIRHMGVTSVRDIQRALAALGLRLEMTSAAVAVLLNVDPPEVHDCDAFLEVMQLLIRSGIRTADVTRMTPDEVLALPGLGPDTLAVLQNGLGRWGLSLRPFPQESADVGKPVESSGALQTTGPQAAADACRSKAPETFREELTQAVARLLEDAKGVSPQAFLAYYGADGAPKRTLQEIGDGGSRYGFARPVTRERVRQILQNTERRLKARSRRMQFVLWQTAVEEARRHLPASSQSFTSCFGYRCTQDPDQVFEMLRFCGTIFKLEFPFDLRTLNGFGPLVIGPGHDAELAFVSRLKEAASGPYADLEEVASRIDSETESVAKIVDASPQWEFLDDIRRYFWRRPSLPPRNYAITGNAILTSLCKVFSVATRATSADLVRSIPRDRMLRKDRPIADLPVSVLEGVAKRSGLFNVDDGQIARMPGSEWAVVGQRDMALLTICAEHGRVVPSHAIYSGLVRSGLSRENAAATVAYSPFLVHTRSGVGYKEGIYKFVVRPEDFDLGDLNARVSGGDEENGTKEVGEADLDGGSDASEASEMCLWIPVSSRTRLSGRFFASEPVGLDGAWDVQTRDGIDIGRVII